MYNRFACLKTTEKRSIRTKIKFFYFFFSATSRLLGAKAKILAAFFAATLFLVGKESDRLQLFQPQL